jgi:predicted regulator of Ras-like GTPase activity (Roadblock/LC7/MglB family)
VPFKAVLGELVSSVRDATSAIVLEADGEAVQWHTLGSEEMLRLRCAYIAVVMQSLRASASRLGLGRSGCFVLEYDGATFVIGELDESYFVALELGPAANVGLAIHRIRPAVARLRLAL